MRDSEDKQEIVRNVNSLKEIRNVISEVNKKEPLAMITVKMDILEEKKDGRPTV